MEMQIYYMKPEYSRDGGMGFDFCKIEGLLPDINNLDKTHTFLTTIEAGHLEAAFDMMQGEVWSPNGEARDLITSKGLHHTSMTVGDIVKIKDEIWIVDTFGFTLLEKQGE